MKHSASFAALGFLLFLLLASAVCAEPSGSGARTLLAVSGVTPKPARLSESVLVIIDAQREYVDGKLKLEGIDASLKEASLLLERARKMGTPVIHVRHFGKAGGALFDPNGPNVEFAAPLIPKPNEVVVTKALPNAFAGTTLEEELSRLKRKNLIVIGYMTHMCVSSTVRAALDRGYRTTLVAKATATRNLPATEGGEVSAQALQRATLAALADRFATVVQTSPDIPD